MSPIGSNTADRASRDRPATLKLTLFGHMRADDAAGCSVLPRGRKTRAVLAILALSPRGMAPRSHIASLLWSVRENEQARASLRQAVHELQLALSAAGPRLLRADRNNIALAHAGISSDIETLTRTVLPGADVLNLFAHPLLEDLRGLDIAFDNWIEHQSRRLKQQGITIGEALLAATAGTAAATKVAALMLRIDETNTGAWQAAIGAQVALGEHAGALSAYERYRAALARTGERTPAARIEEMVAAIPRAGAPQPGATGFEARASPPPGRAYGADGVVRLGVYPLRPIEPHIGDELAVALVEEITTALAQFRWITCFANILPWSADGSSRPRDADSASRASQPPPQFDFLLDGTLQRSGGHIRVIVQLSDVRAGRTVVWARRFDRDVTDIFALQDEIAAETAAQIDTALLLWEGERVRHRQRGDPDAVDLMLGAIPSIYRLESTLFRKAGELLETALALDSGNAAVHAWLAYWHLFLVGQGWASDSEAATARAAQLAERAVGLDARDARAVTLAGHVRGFLNKRPGEAASLHDRAIALNPNLALAWCFSGLTQSYLGEHAEAIRRIDRAQRLAPHDPHGFFFDTARIMPHLLRREFGTAAAIGRRAIALNPGFSSAYKGMLSALGHLGRHEEAAALCRRLLQLEPQFSVRDAIARSPLIREEELNLYVDGLRRAGLAEE